MSDEDANDTLSRIAAEVPAAFYRMTRDNRECGNRIIDYINVLRGQRAKKYADVSPYDLVGVKRARASKEKQG